jgi:hypothetical protein
MLIRLWLTICKMDESSKESNEFHKPQLINFYFINYKFITDNNSKFVTICNKGFNCKRLYTFSVQNRYRFCKICSKVSLFTPT